VRWRLFNRRGEWGVVSSKRDFTRVGNVMRVDGGDPIGIILWLHWICIGVNLELSHRLYRG